MKNKFMKVLSLIDKYAYQICIAIVVLGFLLVLGFYELHDTLKYGIIKMTIHLIFVYFWCEYNKKYLLIPVIISFMWFIFVW